MNNAKLYLRTAASGLVVIAVITVAACSNDPGGPTANATQGQGRDDGAIYGYVSDAVSSEVIEGVDVKW